MNNKSNKKKLVFHAIAKHSDPKLMKLLWSSDFGFEHVHQIININFFKFKANLIWCLNCMQ